MSKHGFASLALACLSALAIGFYSDEASSHGGLGLGLGFGSGGHGGAGVASTGWQTGGTGTFSITNYALQSNTFSAWATSIQAGSSLTVTDNAVQAPDGSMTASRMVLTGPVSGSNKATVIDTTGQLQDGVTNPSFTFAVWAKVESNTGTGSLYISESVGTSFVSTPITSSNWTLVSIDVPIGKYGVSAHPAPQIGINLFDTNQAAGISGTITVDLWRARVIVDPHMDIVSDADIGGALATTTAAATAILTKPLPAHVLYRNFAGLTASPSNPIIVANGSENYLSGGVSNPFVNSTFTSGGYLYAFGNATSNTDHSAWMSFALWKSPVNDGVNWTEVTTHSPYLQISGSSFTTPSRGTGTIHSFMLHPSWVPFECSDGTTTHVYCIIFSATNNPAGTTFASFMAYADAIDGPYTLLGCSSGTTCAAPTTLSMSDPTGSNYTGANVVSVYNVGGSTGTNYVVAAMNGLAGEETALFSTPANPTSTAGMVLTFVQLLLPPQVSGADWDYGTGYQDNNVTVNQCGFFEYLYTIQSNGGVLSSSKQQAIAYAVAQILPNGLPGSWFKLNSPVIPLTSSMYGGTLAIGDSSAFVANGKYTLLTNFDNGTNLASASAAQMPDVTACP